MREKMNEKRGVALIFAIALTAIFLIVVGTVVGFVSRGYFFAGKLYGDQRALNLAEAGIDKAIYKLNEDPTYSGTETLDLGDGQVETTVEDETIASGTKTLATIQRGLGGAVKDAYVSSYFPSTNYGGFCSTCTTLIVGKTGIPDYNIFKSYLQFDLSPYSGSNFTKAELSLYFTSSPNPEDHTENIYRVTDDWNELDITWNNSQSPPLTTPNFDPNKVWDSASIPLTAGVWIKWDITSLVSGWVAGYYPNYGLVLIDETPEVPPTFYYSSENIAFRPKLSIEYTPTAVLILGTKIIRATSYIPSKANPQFKREFQVKVEKSGEGTSFHYAIQAGNGGVTLDESATIQGALYKPGNVYSNGDITFKPTYIGQITGDAASVGNIIFNSTPSQPYIAGNASTNEHSFIWPDDTKTCDETGPTGYEKFVAGTLECPADLAITSLPGLDETFWKQQACQADTQGNCNPSYVETPPTGTKEVSSGNLGPIKIIGNLKISGGPVIIRGPIYVTGDIDHQGGEIKLDDGFKGNGTVIITDGTITKRGTAQVSKNNYGGYIWLYSTKNDAVNNVIDLSAGGDALAIFEAPSGKISVAGGGHYTALFGYILNLTGAGTITYEEGLGSVYFATGPGATWVIKKGTWQEI